MERVQRGIGQHPGVAVRDMGYFGGLDQESSRLIMVVPIERSDPPYAP